MVAGCDKYMQIVRCFRDEDPRADRQAEFTQLDVEMSFIDVENITTIMEQQVAILWKQILNIDVPLPLMRMDYDEAMSRYGSDRPDLRFGMELKDITDLAHSTDFGVFKNAPMVKCIVVPGGGKLSRKETDALAEWAKGFGAKGLAVTKVTATGLDTGVAKFLAPIAAKLIEQVGAKEGDLLCFGADKPKIVHKVLGELRLKMARDMKFEPSKQYAFLWVVNFPLFDYDEEEGRFVSTPITRSLRRMTRISPSWTRATERLWNRSRARPTTSSATARRSAAAPSVFTAWTRSRRFSGCWDWTRRRRSTSSASCWMRSPSARRHMAVWRSASIAW